MKYSRILTALAAFGFATAFPLKARYAVDDMEGGGLLSEDTLFSKPHPV